MKQKPQSKRRSRGTMHILLASIVVVCCTLNRVLSFSTPLPFGRSRPATTRNLDLASSYVPDGLTEEEYERLKQKEASDQASKDYGSWGPRFRKQVVPPMGDWMIMKTLWTTGGVERSTQPAATSAATTQRIPPSRILSLLALNMAAIYRILFLGMKKLSASRRFVPSNSTTASILVVLSCSMVTVGLTRTLTRNRWIVKRREILAFAGSVVLLYRFVSF